MTMNHEKNGKWKRDEDWWGSGEEMCWTIEDHCMVLGMEWNMNE